MWITDLQVFARENSHFPRNQQLPLRVQKLADIYELSLLYKNNIIYEK